jgi:hypothetical protein
MTSKQHTILTGVAAHGPIRAADLAKRIGYPQPITYQCLYWMVYKKRWVWNKNPGTGGYTITAAGRQALQLAAIDGVQPSSAQIPLALPKETS